MLNTKVFNRLGGYVQFCGLGGFQEKFIEELFQNKIKVWGISTKDGCIRGRIKPTYYLYAARLAKKHGFRIKAEKKKGIPFRLGKYRDRYGIVIGLLLFAFILVGLTNHIWEIRVEGNTSISSVYVLEVFEKLGVKVGITNSTAQYSHLKRKAMLEIKDASWINLRKNGSVLTIEISEGLKKPRIISENQPCNIIALEDAQIIETQVFDGTLVVEEGSGVKKGGIIVSGVVVDTDGNVLPKHASGKIIGEFTQRKELFVPFTSIQQVLGDKTEVKKYMVLLNNIIPLFINEAKMESFQYTEVVEEKTIFGFKLPFQIKKGIYTQYEDKEITYTNEEALKILKQQKKDLEETIYSNYEILQIEEKYFPLDDGIRLELEYKLKGEIGKQEEIVIFNPNKVK